MFRIALVAVGGGYAVIALADEVFSRKRKTISEGQLVSMLPVFQMVPGIMAGHAAVYLGRKEGGAAGAIAALVGVALPSIAIFSLVSAGYDFIPVGNPWLESAFVGLRASLVGIIAAMTARSWGKSVSSPLDRAVFAVTLSLLLFTGIPAVFAIAAALASGIAVSLFKTLGKRLASFTLLPFIFVKYALVAFGGGYVLVPVYINDFVGESARFLQIPPAEFANVMALSQMTPGPIGINAATFFGWKMAGFPGAVAASVALLLPGALLLWAVLAAMERGARGGFIEEVLSFVRPVSTAMMCSAAVSFAGMCIWDVSEKAHVSWCVFSSVNFNTIAAVIGIISAAMTFKKKIRIAALVLLASSVSCVLRADDGITTERFPDADTVLVDSREDVSFACDGTYTSIVTRTVKILTERGRREESVFSTGYSRRYGTAEILSAEARGEDGSVRKIDFAATLKDSTDNSSMASNIYDPLDRTLSCQLPGLKVGDTLVISTRRIAFKPRMENVFADISVFEWDVPVLKSTYSVRAPAGRPLKSIAVRRDAGNVSYSSRTLDDGSVLHEWTATNSPQAFPEPSMPPLWSEMESVRVSTAGDWREISEWYWNLSLPHMEKTTAEMTNLVESLGRDIDRIRIWTAENIRYMGLTMEDTSPGYSPHDVDITFANRYGVCRDKAALLAALLRIAGHEAYPALIHVGAKMDSEVPWPFFNHAVVAVADPSAPDGYRLMDPTPETSRDEFPAYLGMRSYLVARPGGEKLLVSPVKSSDHNSLVVKTKGTVAKDLSAVLETKMSFRGINDTACRRLFMRMTEDERREYLESVVSAAAGGAEVLSCEISPANLSDMAKPLEVSLVSRVREIGVEGAGSYELCPPFVSGAAGIASRMLSSSASLDKRRFTLEMFSTARDVEEIELELPDSFGECLYIPENVEIGSGCSFSRVFSASRGRFSVKSVFSVDTLAFPPEEYAALLDTLEKREAAGRRHVSFAKNPLASADVRRIFSSSSYNLSSAHSWVATNVFSKEILTYDGKKRSSELVWNYNPAVETVRVISACVANPGRETVFAGERETNVMDAGWVSAAPRYPAGKKLVVNLPSVEIGSVVTVTSVVETAFSPLAFRKTFVFDSTDPAGEIAVSVSMAGSNVFSRVVKNAVRLDSEPAQPDSVLWRDTRTVSFRTREDSMRFFSKAAETEPCAAPFEVDGALSATGRVEAVRNWTARHVRIAGPSLFSLPAEMQLTSPGRVIAERYATRLDYIRTMVSLMKGQGLDASVVFVADDARDSLEKKKHNEANPDCGRFSLPFCRVSADGGVYFIGTENEYTPLGSAACEGGSYIDPAGGATGTVECVRADLSSRREKTVAIRLCADGSADVDVEERIYGNPAGAVRKYYSEILPEDLARMHMAVLKGYFRSAAATSGLSADVKSYPARVSHSFHVPDFAVVADGCMTFSLVGFDGGECDLASSRRKTPFVLGASSPSKTTVRVHLPEGWNAIESCPQPFCFDDPSLGIVDSFVVEKPAGSGNELVFTRERSARRAVVRGPEHAAGDRARAMAASGRGARMVKIKKGK